VGRQLLSHTCSGAVVSGPRTVAIDGAGDAVSRGAVLGGTVEGGASAATVNFRPSDGVGQSGRADVVACGGADVGGPRTQASPGAATALYCVAVLGGTIIVAASVPAICNECQCRPAAWSVVWV
jgi:hypothetical protein